MEINGKKRRKKTTYLLLLAFDFYISDRRSFASCRCFFTARFFPVAAGPLVAQVLIVDILSNYFDLCFHHSGWVLQLRSIRFGWSCTPDCATVLWWQSFKNTSAR